MSRQYTITVMGQNMQLFWRPTKMGIKSAPYLLQNSAYWALNMVLFYALVQILHPT